MTGVNPESKRKVGGGKLARSETVTVRLDPKLRYLAELAARKQRRTVSSFIEWAVEQSFKAVDIYVGNGYDGDESIAIADEATKLWDVDESERFVKLAIYHKDLLNHEEQILWKVLLDSELLNIAKSRIGSQLSIHWKWDILDDCVFPVLRQKWDGLQEAVANDMAPQWIEATRAAIKKGTIFPQVVVKKVEPEADRSDDIPF